MEFVKPEEETAKEAIEEIRAELFFFDDWTQRYQFLIDLGKALPEFPTDAQTDKNKIDGCQSQVWLVCEKKDDKLFFTGTSDAAIVKGLVSLLLRVYSGRSAEEILSVPADFLQEMGLMSALSPTRGNGVGSMIMRIRAYAQKMKS